MRSLGRFRSNGWISEVDVPTAVIVTTRDRTVMSGRQRRLAQAIPHAVRFDVVGPHDAIVRMGDIYVPTLLEAMAHVTDG
jgi:3-oxoadipate enol-lactonase